MVLGVPTNYRLGFDLRNETQNEYLIEYRCRLATQRSVGENGLSNQ